MTKLRRAVLKALNPAAFEDSLMQRVLEHERRMSSDPDIQARHAEERREEARDKLPWFGMWIAVNTVLVAAIAYWLPGSFWLETAKLHWLLAVGLGWLAKFGLQSPGSVWREAGYGLSSTKTTNKS